MSHPFGPKTLAILNHLVRKGHKSRFELERELGLAQLATHINKLLRGGYIKRQPKERGELVRYEVTTSGAGVVGAYVQRQESLRYRPIGEMPTYVPKPFMSMRPGAMDAFALPSRGLV